MNIKIGKIANYLAALVLLAMGLLYLLKNSFMPYHSDAIMLEWNEVDNKIRALILALMRAVAGGYISVAVAIGILQKKFTTSKITWVPFLILIIGLIVSLASIYATIIVRLNSPGQPPTGLAIFGILLLIVGYLFNRRSLNDIP